MRINDLGKSEQNIQSFSIIHFFSFVVRNKLGHNLLRHTAL